MKKLAVEINGLTHYYNTTSHLLPKYQLKNKVFEAANMNYMDINCHDYMINNDSSKTEHDMDRIIKDLEKRLNKKGKQKKDPKDVFL